LPHAPQLVASLCSSTQAALPHWVYPELHAKVQERFTQAGCAWVTDVVHAFPQDPQSAALLVTSTHAPEQSAWLEEHALTHA
jgi:hypothetical protein